MEVIGIDVSKGTFDAWSKSLGHKSFKNEKKGFSELLIWGGDQAHYVMESTCSYHIQLAVYLFDSGCKVSVVNPLPVKRYMQMKLQRLKTDKSDAKMLSLYGAAEQPKLWQPEASYIQECKLMMSIVELYLRQQTALKNKLDNLQSGGVKQGKLISSLKLQIKRVKAEILKLEEGLQEVLKEQAGEEMTQLTSIPGVGKKTAAMLLVY